MLHYTSFISDAVVKLDEAVKLDSSRGDSFWWLGNAHTTRGFQTPDPEQAGVSFEKAQDCFRKAIDLVGAWSAAGGALSTSYRFFAFLLSMSGLLRKA